MTPNFMPSWLPVASNDCRSTRHDLAEARRIATNFVQQQDQQELENMAESALPKFLKAADVADWLGISEQSLAADRFRGEGIPYVKVGHRVRYRFDEVLKYIEANTQEVAPHAVPANRPARVHRAKRV